MKKIILLTFVFFLGVINLYSQDDSRSEGAFYCSQKKIHNPNYIALSPMSQNSPRHTFDMLDTKMNINLYSNFKSPYPRNYSANVIDKFRVDSTLNSITLNAVNTSLAVDSVRLYPSNTTLAFTQISDILTITLDRTYSPGEIAQVRIYYRHLAIADNVFYCSNGGVFTDCEPEGARHWFPCWDRPSDKATYDMMIKVPANVRIGSNGRLNDSTLTGDSLYYHWISRDPISTYLVVMTGKVNYNMTVIYWHKISNPNDSVPMRYYWNSGENPTSDINAIRDMTTFYSQKFGEYPFEKGGFTTAPASGFTWGGMENQTLITYCPNCWVSYTSHEYAHMWFGDMITCATWADIWVNEGHATFCEALYREHTSGYASYKSAINSDASYYLSYNPGWAISVPSWETTTPDVNTLFDLSITYDKGACVLHMLRYVLGDTVFFNALHTYGTDTTNFKFKTARIQDYNAMWNIYTGQNLDWFFNEWIYQPNHPVYANTYNITNTGTNQWRLKFYANQTQSNTPFHKMPITLRIPFTSGPADTVRVMNDVNGQVFIFDYTGKQPTAPTFDPNNDIVLKSASLLVGATGNETQIPEKFSLYQNYPNPFNPVTVIKYDVPENSNVKITVYDATGKEVKTLVNEIKSAGKHEVMFNGVSLSSGVYYYKIVAGNFSDIKKLVLVK
ncbi:MAG TPA: M1 family aminopeptidase [Ignavibacteria bacterium]